MSNKNTVLVLGLSFKTLFHLLLGKIIRDEADGVEVYIHLMCYEKRHRHFMNQFREEG